MFFSLSQANRPLCAQKLAFGVTFHRFVSKSCAKNSKQKLKISQKIQNKKLPIKLHSILIKKYQKKKSRNQLIPPHQGKAQCSYPGDPQNGLISPLKFLYDVGDYLSIQCREGFVIHPNNNPERPKCLSDGNWSTKIPECKNYEEV